MTARDARIVYRPLESWPDPPGEQVFTPFSAPWSTTLDLLQREADHLGAPIVVVELDVAARDFRRDDQLRASARVHSEKVRITVESSWTRQTLCWHTDRYRLPRGGQEGWKENVRAIAKTMESLRAVERYGAVHGSEQYRGFAAIEARPAGSFSSPEEALRWLRAETAGEDDGPDERARHAYRAAARRTHPDQGGGLGEWSRLQEARELLEVTELW